MFPFGCYCGCASWSNRIRWVVVTALFLAGIVAFVMASVELSRCRKPCSGGDRQTATKERIKGVSVYRCSQNPGVLRTVFWTSWHKSCHQPAVSESLA
jgi:hypothetical protein